MMFHRCKLLPTQLASPGGFPRGKSMEDKIEFPDGIFVKAPHQNAPDFVKGRVTIKLDEAIAYLQ